MISIAVRDELRLFHQTLNYSMILPKLITEGVLVEVLASLRISRGVPLGTIDLLLKYLNHRAFRIRLCLLKE